MPSTGCQVRFYYHIMSSSDVLNVYVRTEWQSDPMSGLTAIYSTAQDSSFEFGDFWQKKVVDIPSPSKSYQGGNM